MLGKHRSLQMWIIGYSQSFFHSSYFFVVDVYWKKYRASLYVGTKPTIGVEAIIKRD